MNDRGAAVSEDWCKDTFGHLENISPLLDEGDAFMASLNVGRVIDVKRGRAEAVELDPGVKGDRIQALGLFNERALNIALRAWSHASTSSTNSLNELFSWIATLDEFLKIYEIAPERPSAKRP